MLLRLEELTVRRPPRTVLDRISLTIAPGEVCGLIGPNGAGKTTLLRAALGLLPASGLSSLAQMPAPARARAAAFLPQSREISWPLTVERVVALGRFGSGRSAADDAAAVDQALAALGLTGLRQRPATALSGGEQARALLARALAQETPLLIADEPAAGLDPAQALGMMALFRDLAASGRSVLASIHDLSLAAQFCTRLILLHEGRLVADGPPDEVLSPALLAQSFGISGRLAEIDGQRIFIPGARLG